MRRALIQEAAGDWLGECTTLCIAYANHADACDFSALAGLFAEGGTFDRRGQVLRGREAIIAAVRNRPGSLITRHVISDIVIHPDGPTRAFGRSCFAVYRAFQTEMGLPLPPDPIIGEYHDRYVQTADGWRFAHRSAKPRISRTII